MSFQLEYVHSGMGYMGIQPTKYMKENPEHAVLFHKAIHDANVWVKEKASQVLRGTLTIGGLYNAYTEAEHGEWHAGVELGLDNLYADSGGLQAATLGIVVDDKFKPSIYEKQAVADFGFCFDEIPVGLKEGESNRHRSTMSSKQYYPDKTVECARATAMNIKQQCQAFQGKDTKVFYILQGNTAEDMVTWFEQGVDLLTEEEWDKVQGIALAAPCIGSGDLEMVHSCKALHIIQQKYPQYAKKHVHFLGVGSATRLVAPMLLRESGFLARDTYFSTDSSSCSMAYVMGHYTDRNGNKMPKGVKPIVLNMFRQFWGDLGHILQEVDPSLTEERLISDIEKYLLSPSKLVNENPDHTLVYKVFLALVPLWQVYCMTIRLMKHIDTPKGLNSPIGQLHTVGDLEALDQWYRTFSRFVNSKPVHRYNPNDSLVDLFG